ncbi:hypothetical protein RsTz2092_06850 [Deferribacterales bacterium RsTz2092]|nr:hypothetical protein AGMMS49941_05000 [Deferribacterales bacterium]
MNSEPLISVGIPTYNNAAYIRQAIDSILSQGYENIEIVVADSSTDGTKAIVEGYNNKKLKYFFQEKQGLFAARNLCVEKASGSLMAWLDGDDYYEAGKLCAQLEYMRERPDCEIVFTRYKNFLEDESMSSLAGVQREISFEKSNRYYLNTSLTKRATLDKMGVFIGRQGLAEDIDMTSRMKVSGVELNHLIDNVYYHRRIRKGMMTLAGDYSLRESYLAVMGNLRKGIVAKNAK